MKKTKDIDTSTVASKKDLASLETKVNDSCVDKIKTVPFHFSYLSNVADNDIAKKTVYNSLIIKVIANDNKIPSTSDYLLKHTMIQTDKVLRIILKMSTKR